MNREQKPSDDDEHEASITEVITSRPIHSRVIKTDATTRTDEIPSSVKAATTYVIIEEMARGGMGIVYRALDINLHREVAFKTIMAKHAQSKPLVQRFLNESCVMSYLLHPGIAQIYECGVFDDGRPFYSMQMLHGTTLHDLLKDREEDSLANLLSAFAFICQSIAYTHSRGILHLDIKPSNIMVGSFGEVHVMDWGLAMIQTGEHDAARLARGALSKNNFCQPELGQVQGTPQYMSPEQARGIRTDCQADVFSLGAILTEILTGLPPYRGYTFKQVYTQAREGQLYEATKALDECKADSRLIRLAKNCLARDPADRFETAEEVSQELTDYHQSALARVESDMSRFFEISLDLFCIAGFDGYFRRINPNFSRVLGYTEDVLLAKPFLEFIHPEDKAQTVRQMSVLLEGQPVVRFRNRYQAADGRFLEFEWTAKSIPEENIIFAVARNVSE